MTVVSHLYSPPVTRSITPVAASTTHPVAARTAARRARLSVAESGIRLGTAGRVRCSARPAQAAASRLRCRSSPAATGRSTARTATRTIADRRREASHVDAGAPDEAAAVHAACVAAGRLEPTEIRVSEGGLTTRCRQCHKSIVWPGLCYTCATGLPRQLRPRENTAAEGGPRHQDAGSNQPCEPG